MTQALYAVGDIVRSTISSELRHGRIVRAEYSALVNQVTDQVSGHEWGYIVDWPNVGTFYYSERFLAREEEPKR